MAQALWRPALDCRPFPRKNFSSGLRVPPQARPYSLADCTGLFILGLFILDFYTTYVHEEHIMEMLQIPADFVKFFMKDLESAAIRAYLLLLAESPGVGAHFTGPTLAGLASAAGLSERAVRLGLRALEEVKLIERIFHNGKASAYIICPPPEKNCCSRPTPAAINQPAPRQAVAPGTSVADLVARICEERPNRGLLNTIAAQCRLPEPELRSRLAVLVRRGFRCDAAAAGILCSAIMALPESRQLL